MAVASTIVAPSDLSTGPAAVDNGPEIGHISETVGSSLETIPLVAATVPTLDTGDSSPSGAADQMPVPTGAHEVAPPFQYTGDAPSSALPLYVDQPGLAYWTQSQIAEVGDLYATVAAACFRISDIMKDIRNQTSPF